MSKQESRTVNSLRNAAFSMGGKMMSILIEFATRTLFIELLGTTYTGAADLMTTVLSALNLSELGVGMAMLYAMYKPIAEKDEAKLSALFRLFKKLYFFIGLAVVVLGAGLYPFLIRFVEDTRQIEHFGAVYVLYLVKSVVTYWFFACNGTLFVAHQKRYIQTMVETVTHILALLTQIAILIWTHDFLLYISVAILWQMVTQFVLYKRSMKMFPYLHQKNPAPLGEEEKQGIRRNIFGMSLYRLSSTVLTTTDNFIISSAQGLTTTSVYGNYMLIINSVQQIIKAFFFASTASIGDLHVTATEDQKHEVFYNISFASYWVAGFCGICCFVLFNPFMELWRGSEAILLGRGVVALIVLNNVIEGFYLVVMAFKDACGLYWKGKFRPVATAVINLGSSLILVRYMGIAGVVIGTIASRLLTTWWYDVYLLYSVIFKRSSKKYYFRYIGYLLIMVAVALLTEYVGSFIDSSTIMGFLGLCALCVILPNAIFVLLFHRVKEFRYFLGMIKRLAGRFLRR